MATFEVVVLALAPERHLKAFVDHYRGKGADRIRVYFDGPGETAPAPDAVGLTPDELTVCGPDVWTALGGRPASVEDRQRAVYADAYRRLDADWLLVVDVDEAIFGDVAVAAVLDAAPSDCPSVIFSTVEAVYAVGRDDVGQAYGGSLARKSWAVLPVWAAHLIYPGVGDYFVRGLLGHHMGKHAVRRGLDGVMVCIHESKRDDQPLKACRARDPRTGRPAWLLHYDAIGLDAWRVKWDRRTAAGDTMEMGRRRRRQHAAYVAARSRGEEAALFNRLYGLNRAQRAVLRALGLLTAIPAGSGMG